MKPLWYLFLTWFYDFISFTGMIN